jgi:hypothetical protein
MHFTLVYTFCAYVSKGTELFDDSQSVVPKGKMVLVVFLNVVCGVCGQGPQRLTRLRAIINHASPLEEIRFSAQC